MTDLAERLRNVANPCDDPEDPEYFEPRSDMPEGHAEVSRALLIAAADELDRLRDELADWQQRELMARLRTDTRGTK